MGKEASCLTPTEHTQSHEVASIRVQGGKYTLHVPLQEKGYPFLSAPITSPIISPNLKPVFNQHSQTSACPREGGGAREAAQIDGVVGVKGTPSRALSVFLSVIEAFCILYVCVIESVS